MNGLLTVMQAVGAFLGAWTLVSVATAMVVAPVLRARAQANHALTRRHRAVDWESVAQVCGVPKVAAR